MFTIINIISIIIGKFHARAWLWLHSSIFCLSHIWMEVDIPVWKIVLHALVPGCSMALFWSFHPAVVSLLSPEKLSDNHPLGKLRQRDRINITGLNEWCRQTKKLLAWNRTCWFKLQFLLNSVPFLQQCFKVVSEKNTFSTAKNILDFFFNFSLYIIYNLK